jgi:hypothetical protein
MFSIKMPWTRRKERLEELAELAEVQRRQTACREGNVVVANLTPPWLCKAGSPATPHLPYDRFSSGATVVTTDRRTDSIHSNRTVRQPCAYGGNYRVPRLMLWTSRLGVVHHKAPRRRHIRPSYESRAAAAAVLTPQARLVPTRRRAVHHMTKEKIEEIILHRSL